MKNSFCKCVPVLIDPAVAVTTSTCTNSLVKIIGRNSKYIYILYVVCSVLYIIIIVDLFSYCVRCERFVCAIAHYYDNNIVILSLLPL